MFDFTDFACADGWAIATGTGAGYTGQVIALLNVSDQGWQLVELDNGTTLGSFPSIYDIPLSLLRQLSSHFGAALQPEVATGPLIASPAMTGWEYVNRVINVNGALWYIAERPTGNPSEPQADANVYRWSGTGWMEQGEIDRVPESLNYFQGPGAFQAVTVPGTNTPGFILVPGGTAPLQALTDTGGRWHASPYPSAK
jgi:hypothetical protein